MGERTGEQLRRTEAGAPAAVWEPGAPPVAPAPPAAEGADETPETAAIREDIEQTRAEMSGTIDAIQDKIDPEVLQAQAKDTIREARDAAVEVVDHALAQTREAVRGATIGKVENMARYAEETAGGWRDTLLETVKAHPVPAALAGLSLGYLFLNRERPVVRATRHGGTIRYDGARDGSWSEGGRAPGIAGPRAALDGDGGAPLTDRAGAMAGRARETAGAVAGQARETASQAVDQVQATTGQAVEQAQETVGQVAEQAREQASRAQSFLGQQLEENPLAVGAVAVVLGGALGAAMGTTPREDRWFGDTRDRLMGRAQEMTQETLEQVEHRVGRVVGEVKDTASKAAEEISGKAEREARAQGPLPAPPVGVGPPRGDGAHRQAPSAPSAPSGSIGGGSG